jgi:hypothetical protein
MSNVYVTQITTFTIPHTKEEIVSRISSQLELECDLSDAIEEVEDGKNQYRIVYDTEGGCLTNEDYDSLQCALHTLQTGLACETWSSESKDGTEQGVNYYNKNGEEVDIANLYERFVASEATLRAVADALWGEDAEQEWNSDTTEGIAECIETMRPDIKMEYNK